jgi:small subunit ribosomal protein S1
MSESEETQGPSVRKSGEKETPVTTENTPAEAVTAQVEATAGATSAPPADAAAPEAVAAAAPRRRMVDVAAQVPERKKKPTGPEPVDESQYDGLEEDFAAMLNGSMPANSKRAPSGPGETVQGTVVLIGDDNVFIDLGDKTEGFLTRKQVTDREGNLTVAIGDVVEAYVVRRGAAGVELTRALGGGGDGSDDEVHSAWSGRLPVEGKVQSRNKGGYEVTVFGKRAFCPISQIELDYTEDGDAHLEKTYRFLITKVDGAGKKLNIVVSRAELLREERAADAAKTLVTLKEGAQLQGTVRRLAKFGAFVDLGGIDGLVHVSEISWGRVDDPADILSVGQRVTVEVLSMDLTDDPAKSRISLSMKSCSSSPWDNMADQFQEGGIYPGTVVRIQNFGAFVELAPGIDGLIHVSEMSLRRVAHPKDVVTQGQAVQVQVLGIDTMRQRISLSMKSMDADPWDSVETRYTPGTSVKGVIENVEDFGVFVELEPGLTALLPNSEMGQAARGPRQKFRKGDTLEAAILAIDTGRRRLSLTLLDEEAREQRDRERGPRRDQGGRERRPVQHEAPAEPQTMGTFADLFAKKLRGRK